MPTGAHVPKRDQVAALERLIEDLPKVLEKKPPDSEGEK